MSLLIKANQTGREIVRVTPASAGWTHVGFSALRLAAGEQLTIGDATREQCLVVLSGTISVKSGEHRWHEIGERSSVFEQRSPYAVYLPAGQRAEVVADSDAELGLASAPGQGGSEGGGNVAPRLIEPGSMKRSVRGKDLNTRYVCDILPETEPADALLVVEVVTPSGHASSYPPHKHDTDNIPEESSLEETYYHRLSPSQGFAFQRVYTDDRSLDEAMAVEDHDVVMVPRGYHPVVAPYGYDSYYLNVMAGAKRQWHFKNDPAHEWMLKP